MTDPSRPPFDDVRAAFERLATPDKAAFVLEATFDTIGQALGETGRRVSEAVSSLDLDALFRMPSEPAAGPSSGPASAPPPSRPKRSGPSRPAPGTPPTDDGPSAN
jgi:hypothetical protein